MVALNESVCDYGSENCACCSDMFHCRKLSVESPDWLMVVSTFVYWSAAAAHSAAERSPIHTDWRCLCARMCMCCELTLSGWIIHACSDKMFSTPLPRLQKNIINGRCACFCVDLWNSYSATRCEKGGKSVSRFVFCVYAAQPERCEVGFTLAWDFF